MNRKLLLVAFLVTLALTILAAGHQLTNAAPNMAPPPQHAPSIASMTTAVTPTWYVVAGGGGKAYHLIDVSMASPTDGWAVGWAGLSSYSALLHYDGVNWSQTSAPTGTYDLNATAMISPTEGWAVGFNACGGTCNHNLLMHYTQTGWQRAALPLPGSSSYTAFNDIDIKGSAGWIVGDAGYFLRYNGSNWTSVTAPLDPAYAVSVVNAGEAWAVGSNYPLATSNIARWTGSAWSLVTPTYHLLPNYQPILYGVDVLDGGAGWAVGVARYSSTQAQCLIVHYTGGAWTQVPCLSNAVSLNDVAMRSPNDVWAVGYLGSSSVSGAGVIYHFNGSTWLTATAPSGTPNLNSVELVGANDGWIVGNGGTILRLVNGAWTRVQGSTLYVGPIDAVNASEVWYGGPTGQLDQWKDGATTTYTTLITTSISALDMISPTLGWAAGRSPNRLVQYSDAVTTSQVFGSRIQDISALDQDHAWFGLTYNILRYESGGYYWDSGVNSYGATSISMADPAHGWAMGSWVKKVLTYTNGVWGVFTPTITFAGPYQYLKVVGVSPSEAWVAGYSLSCTTEECPISAELHHFASGVWTSIPVPDWRAFLDISKVRATEWWAAGKLKTGEYAFLHYKDGVFATVPAAGEDVQQVSMLPDGTGFASGIGSVLWLIDLPNKVYLPTVRR